MSEHLTYEQALRKVAALLKLAERTTSQSEAAEAAARAQTLMERYQIEHAAAVERQDETREPDEPIEPKHEALDKFGERLPEWKWRLAKVVMRANGCFGFLGAYTKRVMKPGDENYNYFVARGGQLVTCQTIEIVGRRSDVQAARYIYSFLLKECESLVALHGKGKGKTWRNNFRLGLVEAVSNMFQEQKERLHLEMQDEATRSVDPKRALVRVNDAIQKRESAADEANKAAHEAHQLVSVKRNYNIVEDYSARSEGRKAGESIRLGSARAGLGAGTKKIGEGE